mmetsp:Transcript_57446/g.181875  ORF Transcript_57446/g.181875 Transcript_57446/m.181875 type:complete len:99 (+) Transcript_57446:3605-3901(+)
MHHLQYQQLVTFIKSSLRQLNIDPDCYSSHSLRRGGAMFAFLAGVSPELIKLHGDWASDAYQAYLMMPPAARVHVTAAMLSAISHGELGGSLIPAAVV